jgi:hypothetical protein
MRGDQWSGDRMPRNRIMLMAVPLIVVMAVGLIVGIRLVGERDATLRLSNTGQRAANSTPATVGPAGGAVATLQVTPSPTPTASAPAATAPTPTAITPTAASTP